MPSVCHRCHRGLPKPHGAGGGAAPARDLDDILLFCPYCAAPQVRLPEYSRAPVASPASTGAVPPPYPNQLQAGRPAAFSPAPAHVNCRAALRAGALVAAVTAVCFTLGLIGGDTAVGSIGAYLSTLLTLSGAVLAVALYAQLSPRTHLTASRGLSIGTVTGLLIVFLTCLLVALAGVTARFVLHSAAFNAAVEAQFAAMQQMGVAIFGSQPNGGQIVAQFNRSLGSPDYRAGITLGGVVMQGVCITGISALGGAAAGLLRTPRRQPR